jgi:simple sugar transport system permease protein
LIITGIGTLIAFKAGVFNIGVEGSFIAGSFTAAIVGSSIDLPGPIQIFVAMGAATAAGAAIGWGPGWLKARLGVDEVVVTLMGNFVVAGVVSWLLNDFFLAQGTGNASSETVASQSRLPSLIDGTQLTVAFLLALALVAATQWWLTRTTSGFELRMVGANPRFALAQGIDVGHVVIASMVVSGALGGWAGSTFTLGTLGRFVVGAGANLGFNGIAVALLGRLHPVGALIAAIVLGALAAAGPTVQLFIDVPLDVVRIMQGTIMIAAVIPVMRGGA